jgi:hypothetical protein
VPKIRYQTIDFKADSLATIQQANQIIDAYRAQGYVLTLRQLYYQFVARDLIPNNMRSYKRLGSVINDGRLAGLIDWAAIEDRTRNLESLSHWDTPADIVQAVAEQFNVDRWENQPNRIEVWIEKDALTGVIERVCQRWDVAYFSCRGYTSQSELWGAAMRLRGYSKAGQQPVVLHFGDHDPSGKDMTRDIEDRFRMFGAKVDVRRLALTMGQVDEYGPPPNPAKLTDSRAQGYIAEFGDDSWELDALEPAVIEGLIEAEIESIVDTDLFQQATDRQQKGRDELQRISDSYETIIDHLDAEGL